MEPLPPPPHLLEFESQLFLHLILPPALGVEIGPGACVGG